ncbi:unnamed protein product [Symbiodinium natans]|uniref:Uncharacterized protein n=1 Tax=Symbiodinium natans TaxID=878477 RepID=A0A812HQQ2_9DINO|nr:unnamed protein product [Symbiodinium natans]
MNAGTMRWTLVLVFDHDQVLLEDTLAVAGSIPKIGERPLRIPRSPALTAVYTAYLCRRERRGSAYFSTSQYTVLLILLISSSAETSGSRETQPFGVEVPLRYFC